MVMEGGRLWLDFHIKDGGQFDVDGKVDVIGCNHQGPGGAGAHGAVGSGDGAGYASGVLVLKAASTSSSRLLGWPLLLGQCGRALKTVHTFY